MTPSLSDFVVPVTRTAGLGPWRHTLPNGVVVLGKASRKTPAVTISLSFRAGSVFDPVGRPGGMHLLSKVIDRGTATRSGAEIAEALEDRGASLAVVATRHAFSVQCTCLAEDFAQILTILADVVMDPSVPDSELAIQKGEVLTHLRQDADSPSVRASEHLMTLLYGSDHPYGQPARGTADVIEQMTRTELLDLHRLHFAPSVLTAVIVGDVDEAVAVDATQAAFGTWQRPAPPTPVLAPVQPASVRRRVVIPMMNKSQTDIAYGFTTITRSDDRYYAFWLLNVALGQYAMGGRLGENIRERQGMAYYASSSFDANVLPGPLVVRAGVSAANVDRTIRSIDEELTLVRRAGITERELVESRQYMIGSMPRALETNAGIAQFLQTCEFFGLGLDHDVRLPDLLESVTLEQVRALADRYLDPERASIVVAGPYDAP